MAKVRRQSDEVPGNFAALGAALFQNAGCESMTKIMDAWLLISLRRDASTNAPACLGKPFMPSN